MAEKLGISTGKGFVKGVYDEFAENAENAENAEKAGTATKAKNDSEGNNIKDSYLHRWGGTMTGSTYYWHTDENPALPAFEADDVPVACLGVGAWEELDEETGLGGYPLKRIPNAWTKEDITLAVPVSGGAKPISWRDYNGLYAVKLINKSDEFNEANYTLLISPDASKTITRSSTVSFTYYTTDGVLNPCVLWLEYLHGETPEVQLKAFDATLGRRYVIDSEVFDVYWKKVY